MRIAIPVWHCRVSPLLDSAFFMRIYQIDRDGLDLADEFIIGDPQTQELPSACADHLVDLIICGGLSNNLKDLLQTRGIAIQQGVTGDADEVICAFYTDKQIGKRFHMPGNPAMTSLIGAQSGSLMH